MVSFCRNKRDTQTTKLGIPSPTLDSYLSIMTSTNDIVYGKLNKKAMTKNYTIRTLNKEFHLKAPDNKHFSRENQLLPSILREINPITGATKK